MWRGHKYCNTCQTTRPLAQFSKDTTKKNKYNSNCKDCRIHKEYLRRQTGNYKVQLKLYKSQEHVRLREKDNSLKRIFKISLNEYKAMLKKQNNKCAICKQKEVSDKAKRSLAVDHCHTTGKIRGLLCSNCNLGLGNLKDNIIYLNSAIEYLSQSSIRDTYE